MGYSVSDTAEYDNYVSGPRIITQKVKAEMKKLLKAIQDGSFADALDRKKPSGGQGKELGIYPQFSKIVISTRRFCRLPRSVLFSATGSRCPIPRVVTWIARSAPKDSR